MTPEERMSECNDDIQECAQIPQALKDYMADVTSYVGGTNPNKPHPRDYLPQ